MIRKQTPNIKIIDISMPLKNGFYDPTAPKISYKTHNEGGDAFCSKWGINRTEFYQEYYAAELITLVGHSGTHVDAPWHFGPLCEGKKAKTIDQVPLEVCFGDGVLLDMTHKKRGEEITVKDLEEALRKIRYKIAPKDIVLIRTDASKHFEEADFEFAHPGMTKESTIWLIEKGVKLMGTDGWGWDRPTDLMSQEWKMGNREKLWPAHLVGREKEYYHIERLANLEKIPIPFGFKVAAFPIKIEGGSAGWTRAVAILGL